MCKKVTIISDQARRLDMEDRHILDVDFRGKGEVFGGVYDGHCGWEAADYVARNLHQRFQEFLAKQSPDKAFITAYLTISDEITTTDGTCAANFYLKGKNIYWANVGDCRIIVIGKEVKQLTVLHRVSNDSEKERVAKAGAIIKGQYAHRPDNGGLMPLRTLGDLEFKEIGIIATPSTGVYEIKPSDKYLIAGTDGLFDVITKEDISQLIKRRRSVEVVGRILKEEVLNKRFGEDNLTMIVLKLN